MNNVLTALTYIDRAHAALATAIAEEKDSSMAYINELYDYGLSEAHLHKVKLANIKKSILSITGNKTYKQIAASESSVEDIHTPDCIM